MDEYEDHSVEGYTMGGTQMFSQTMDTFTQQAAAAGSSSEGRQKPNPDVDVWGLLRRKGADQEEIKLIKP